MLYHIIIPAMWHAGNSLQFVVCGFQAFVKNHSGRTQTSTSKSSDLHSTHLTNCVVLQQCAWRLTKLSPYVLHFSWIFSSLTPCNTYFSMQYMFEPNNIFGHDSFLSMVGYFHSHLAVSTQQPAKDSERPPLCGFHLNQLVRYNTLPPGPPVLTRPFYPPPNFPPRPPHFFSRCKQEKQWPIFVQSIFQ